MQINGEGPFYGKYKPDVRTAWMLYEESENFNTNINLYDTVKANENFYIGRQWEGVEANGLPTPVFNILKRVGGFIVSTITTDSVKVTASALSKTPNTDALLEPTRIINEEFDALTKQLKIPSLIRRYTRNSCVDGDGCIYVYWDDNAITGQENVKGAIKAEIIENTSVRFGNPNDSDVQSQPWIMIVKRELTRNARKTARENGISTWADIGDDEDTRNMDAAKRTNGKVTDILLMWKDDETGEVWAYEFTRTSAVKEPYNTNLIYYPIIWLPWDEVQDCYHGQAMITGLIPNQIYINKSHAAVMLSNMRTGMPKYLYDKTKINKLDNRIGAAIGVAGGDLANCIKIIDPPVISPQITQYLQLVQEQTEQSLGATSVALGDTRPDNTSAIVALTRAATTPTEQTKQNLYQSAEDLYRIMLEFMTKYYGSRLVDIQTPENVRQAYDFLGVKAPDMIPVSFDFSTLKDHPVVIKLDAGASTAYSEIASQQTLDNLLMQGFITPVQYLKRIKDDNVPARLELINELEEKERQMSMLGVTTETEGSSIKNDQAASIEAAKPNIPTGGGYSALQRKINQTGDIKAVV